MDKCRKCKRPKIKISTPAKDPCCKRPMQNTNPVHDKNQTVLLSLANWLANWLGGLREGLNLKSRIPTGEGRKKERKERELEPGGSELEREGKREGKRDGEDRISLRC